MVESEKVKVEDMRHEVRWKIMCRLCVPADSETKVWIGRQRNGGERWEWQFEVAFLSLLDRIGAFRRNRSRCLSNSEYPRARVGGR